MKDLFKDVSMRDLEDFKTHPIYSSLLETYKERVELIRNDLETGVGDQYSVLTAEGMRERQGEAKSLRYVLNLVDLMIEVKKQKSTKENKDA